MPLAFQYESQEAVGLVDYLCQVARKREIHFLWRPTLRDPGDEFVLELAVAAGCKSIVTHNIKDFSGAERFGVSVVTPREFLKLVEEER